MMDQKYNSVRLSPAASSKYSKKKNQIAMKKEENNLPNI